MTPQIVFTAAARANPQIVPSNIVSLDKCKAADNGDLYIEVRVDGVLYAQMGPFETEGEREAAVADMLQMMRNNGAREMPRERH